MEEKGLISAITKPIPMVLFGAFIISFSAVWVRAIDVPPTVSGFYRVFLGGLFLIIPSAVAFIKHRYSFTKAELGLIVLCGFFFALDLFFWHRSIFYVGPGLATILGNFQVFILAALGILLLGERYKCRFYLALPAAFFGLFLLVGDWHSFTREYKMGIVYGLLTAVSYACFILTMRKIQGHGKPFYVTLMMISFSTALFFLPLFPVENLSFSMGNSLESILGLVALGLLSQALGWSVIASAMPHIPASLVGLVLLLQPTLSFVWDVLFFGRPTNMVGYLGLGITITAIYIGLQSKR